MMEFVSWDDDIPNRWKNKSHVPNHQPVKAVTILKCLSVNPGTFKFDHEKHITFQPKTSSEDAIGTLVFPHESLSLVLRTDQVM